MLNPLLVSRIDLFFTFFIIVSGFVVALKVITAAPKNKTNFWYFIFSTFIILWVLFGFLYNYADNLKLATLFIRLNFIAVSLLLLSLYFFARHFPTKSRKNHRLDIIITSTTLVSILLILFTDLVIKTIKTADWGKDLVLGKASLFFYLYCICLTFGILYSITKKILQHKKKRSFYFLIGIVIAATLNTTFNVLLPLLYNGNRYYQFGDYSCIFIIICSAYAIIKHQLFNTKVLTIEVFIFAIWLSLLTREILLKYDYYNHFSVVFGVIILTLGLLIIRSTKREIAMREKIEKLSRVKSKLTQIASSQLKPPIKTSKNVAGEIKIETAEEKTKISAEIISENLETAEEVIEELLKTK